MVKFLKFVYNDGTVMQQWNDLYDGKWPYGKEDVHIIKKNYNIYDD